MSKRILFIAYHYPPIVVSSGVHRTLSFSKYLSQWGWDVSVLTADFRAYPRYDLSQLDVIPENVSVIRAWAKDTKRDLSLKGKYLLWLAIPDRYQSWILGGFLRGLSCLRTHRHSAIVSTYPIASAHVIGYLLHRVTGVPWIADFRDPMAQKGYPINSLVRKSYLWIERKAVQRAAALIFVTEGARQYYLDRYRGVNPSRLTVIPNGYDEGIFEKVEKLAEIQKLLKHPRVSRMKTFLHSGVIYPSERDPKPLFMAIKELKEEGVLCKENFKLLLRASSHEYLFAPLVQSLGISELVVLAPPVPYEDALIEMYEADVLVLLQATCENQIPAKAYEYLRVDKQILALTGKSGETARLLEELAQVRLAPLGDKGAIKCALQELMSAQFKREQTAQNLSKYSRVQGAKTLEALLTGLN